MSKPWRVAGASTFAYHVCRVPGAHFGVIGIPVRDAQLQVPVCVRSDRFGRCTVTKVPLIACDVPEWLVRLGIVTGIPISRILIFFTKARRVDFGGRQPLPRGVPTFNLSLRPG